MLSVRPIVEGALQELASFLGSSPFSRDLPYIDSLKRSIDEPCSLAIAGQVKTGKSSFLNALLGENLALVGTTETTATVTSFRYGRAPDGMRPVRCTWVDGRATWEKPRFLDSLQGTDIEALRKANDILRLEYFVENSVLANNVMIVDTPGTNANVDDDVHEERTAEYFALDSALRERHNQETISLSSQADAIVYLTSGVIQKKDSDFLSEFQSRLRSASSQNAAASNVVCLISRADLIEPLMGSAEKRAQYIAIEEKRLVAQLQSPVVVLAVSSQLKSVVATMPRQEWAKILTVVKRGFATAEDLELALIGNDRDFCADDLPSSLTGEERMGLVGKFKGFSWSVIKQVFRALYVASCEEEALSEIERKSGFPEVVSVLQKFFFARGDMLRCNTVVQSVLSYLMRLKNSNRIGVGELKLRKEDVGERFLRFVTWLGTPDGDPFTEQDLEEEFGGESIRKTVRDLQNFLWEESNRMPDAETFLPGIEGLIKKFEAIDKSLDLDRLRYQGLLTFENNPGVCIDEDERSEIGLLLSGRQSFDNNYALRRQMYWRGVVQECMGGRKKFAEIVEEIYARSITRSENEQSV